MKKPELSHEQIIQKLNVFIIKALENGEPQSGIVEKLVKMELKKEDAEKLVNSIYIALQEKIKRETLTGEAYAPAVLGGIIAAVLGGIIWSFIVKKTGYEIGYVALGIGFLSGITVVTLTKGQKGMPLQIIAVVSSLLGIIIGKYLIYFDALKEILSEQYGKEAIQDLSLLSKDTFTFFIENLDLIASEYDIIWIALAFITAWGMLKPTKLKQ